MKNRPTRRDFIKYATMGAAGAAILPPMTARSADNVAGANEKIRMAIIGVGGKGSHHVKVFSGIQGVEIAVVCDADKNHKGGSHAKHHTDMREIFADYSIDAVRANKPEMVHSQIDSAAQSSNLAHYGNTALRVGKKASGAEIKEMLKKDYKALETLGLIEKQLGDVHVDTTKDKYNISDWLKVHKKKLSFRGGDNYKDANRFFSRSYRKEFVVKDKV